MADPHTTVLNVSLDSGKEAKRVGRLAWKDRRIFFEYDRAFLSSRLEISPFKLPLKPGLHQNPDTVFEGLFGVFNDSLPDGWGRLLMDRYLARKSIEIGTLTPLDRLAYVGTHGMGTLSYEPDHSETTKGLLNPLNLNELAKESQHILSGISSDLLDELLALNSASAGARPKVMVGVSLDKSRIIHGTESLPGDMSHWIIKFQALNDPPDAGNIEFAYSLMAKAAGLEIPQTHLFPARETGGFFGIQRFDRKTDQATPENHLEKIHVHTASGLLHADHRYPSLDYQNLLKATWVLTKDVQEVLKIYRMAVFNVLSHNRDDHAKNFAFIMDTSGNWKTAPAYDLTFSPGPAGEHCMMVQGEGRNPTKKHFERLADNLSLTTKQTKVIFEEVLDAVDRWPYWAKESGVLEASIEHIGKRLLQVKSNGF